MIPLILFSLLAQATDPVSKLTVDDLARGKRLYGSWCALCHGQTGEGGKGTRLAQPKLRRAADDKALVEVIQNGIRESEMPGFWMMGEREAWQVAGYVRSLGRMPATPLPGNPERGKGVYAKAGCAACHIVKGEGSSLGPDLSEAGWRRNATHLKESILNPAASVPEGFAMVRAVTRDGREVRGARVSEDSFTIQIRDAANRFHSFRKLDLKDLTKEFNQTTMPSFQSTLTPAEIDDLVAYLASLRGEA